MATFYLLPPRSILANRLLACLGGLLPGVDWPIQARNHLIDAVTEAIPLADDVFVVLREELPVGESVQSALMAGYGAEPGDEVVEVRSHPTSPDVQYRRWQIQAEAA